MKNIDDTIEIDNSFVEPNSYNLTVEIDLLRNQHVR